LLSQHGVEVELRDIGKRPLDARELRAVLAGRPASALYSYRSPTNKQLGIDPRALDDARLVELMAEHVNLARRPFLAGPGGELIVVPDEAAIAALAKKPRPASS
jgi:arsenate reductase-like glutaredoxin family protein